MGDDELSPDLLRALEHLLQSDDYDPVSEVRTGDE